MTIKLIENKNSYGRTFFTAKRKALFFWYFLRDENDYLYTWVDYETAIAHLDAWYKKSAPDIIVSESIIKY